MKELLEFGEGKFVIDTGTYVEKPAVFISVALTPGEVGSSAKREGHPLDRLLPDDIVLTFPTDEQAKAVSDALCNSKNIDQ
jgi:hypothetical protein